MQTGAKMTPYLRIENPKNPTLARGNIYIARISEWLPLGGHSQSPSLLKHRFTECQEWILSQGEWINNIDISSLDIKQKNATQPHHFDREVNRLCETQKTISSKLVPGNQIVTSVTIKITVTIAC